VAVAANPGMGLSSTGWAKIMWERAPCPLHTLALRIPHFFSAVAVLHSSAAQVPMTIHLCQKGQFEASSSHKHLV